jgi:hypothetical protein
VIRLAAFITANHEPILAEWEAFARTRGAAGGAMDVVAQRDHAAEMLTVIAADLNTPQRRDAQADKGCGRAPNGRIVGDLVATAAEEHGAGRAESGFTVEQMVSEYRALQASVIRLRVPARPRPRSGWRPTRCSVNSSASSTPTWPASGPTRGRRARGRATRRSSRTTSRASSATWGAVGRRPRALVVLREFLALAERASLTGYHAAVAAGHAAGARAPRA